MLIDGPSGALETRFDSAARPAGVQAVLCHPHPLYGGSLHDAVLDCLTTVLLRAGVDVLRFNFRGVGASEGRHDRGIGEVDDLLAAARWLQARDPAAALWCGGYSFGAWVTWQALARGLGAARAVLIAPPVGTMAFAPLDAAPAVDVVIGDADDYADPAALAAWRGVRVHSLAGADHFFGGRLDQLETRLTTVVG
jgi:alpha/beta superfamily hydrolase